MNFKMQTYLQPFVNASREHREMINFNVPPCVGNEYKYIKQAVEAQKICGDGQFTKSCNQWIEQMTGCEKALLTTSCTHATELAALLIDIKPGDEVIMPSYTFCSTADAFVLRGAVPVFVDIRPDTMNIDEELIEEAITPKTKAIVPVHYAGVGCEMDKIMDIAKKHNLFVIEDAAQGIMATYKGKQLGAIGDFGCFSFHETKNFSMGEGGAILIKDESFVDKAEIYREKGTDRSKYYRGQVDKYRWQDFGSSYLPSELNAAYLWAQLEIAQKITDDRIQSFNIYYALLYDLQDKGMLTLPTIPEHCKHNAHMFYIKLENMDVRTRFINYMKEHGVHTVFHYIPLHSAPAGIKYARFAGNDIYTTKESERLVRLPMYYGLKQSQVEYICETVHDFFRG